MDLEKFRELVEKIATEKKMLICCISAVPGKEMEFALEMSLNEEESPEQFIEQMLAPSLAQVATELESRLLGTNHDWEIRPGELSPA